jgi:hypothetical protein
MDPVIFTGVLPEHELKEERSNEYARLVAQGRLEAIEAPPPTRGTMVMAYAVGMTAVTVGVVTVILIIYSSLL